MISRIRYSLKKADGLPAVDTPAINLDHNIALQTISFQYYYQDIFYFDMNDELAFVAQCLSAVPAPSLSNISIHVPSKVLDTNGTINWNPLIRALGHPPLDSCSNLGVQVVIGSRGRLCKPEDMSRIEGFLQDSISSVRHTARIRVTVDGI